MEPVEFQALQLELKEVFNAISGALVYPTWLIYRGTYFNSNETIILQ